MFDRVRHTRDTPRDADAPSNAARARAMSPPRAPVDARDANAGTTDAPARAPVDAGDGLETFWGPDGWTAATARALDGVDAACARGASRTRSRARG